ncbi:hypothetical protein ACFOWX_02380 [Sphingorhabdus arenilitoris]|uniref:DUF2059 domain-containing protein n=1 Tax=Sphingorhabdus arenilitoris TaxID=1490041 RepID=A0ABV8RDG2_9SPHN
MSKKMKFTAATALLALSGPLYTAPAWSQDDTELATATEASAAPVMSDKDKKMFEMLAKIFEIKDASPIAPQQLALAEKTIAKIMPQGSYGKLMADLTNKIMTPMLSEVSGEAMPVYEIMSATGVYDDSLDALDADKRKAITALLDPEREARMAKMVDSFQPLMAKASAAIEAPIRKGMARAYARKFSAAQLTELNRFFETPTGAFYAEQSFGLQADPEVMQAMFAALPDMMAEFASAGPEMNAGMEELSKSKTTLDLTETEIQKLAGLMGVTVEALNEGKEYLTVADADVATEGAEAVAAAEDADADPAAYETGEEPWYDSDNWTKSENAALTKLSEAHDKASEKSSAAYEAWETEYNRLVAAYREKYKAQGWQPEAAEADPATEAAAEVE